MRQFMYLCWLLTLAACCPGQACGPTTEETINRETELLIRASLTERIVDDTRDYYYEQAVSVLIAEGMPPEQAEAVFNEASQPLIEIEHQRLVEALVPVYRRFYTPDEIHQLLSFFQTEVARKAARISHQIAAESQQYIRLWSEHFGDELLQRVDDQAKVSPE